MKTDIIHVARSLKGRAIYRLHADPQLAPHVLNCSRLTQWLFSLNGIALPNLAVEQQQTAIAVVFSDLRPEDLIFMVGKNDHLREDLAPGDAGHVGIVASATTYIHACFAHRTVVEERIDEIPQDRFLGFGRILI